MKTTMKFTGYALLMTVLSVFAMSGGAFAAGFLLLAAPAYAQGSGGITMLIVDTDPKGTNVRDAPGGKVTRTIPFGRTDEQIEMRQVTAMEAQGQWFRVTLIGGGNGWMHTSVLGTCASATEDGDPTMHTKPVDGSPAVGKVKDGTKLRLLDVQGSWAKVETAGSGAKKSGWMMEHTLFSNPLNSCWE